MSLDLVVPQFSWGLRYQSDTFRVLGNRGRNTTVIFERPGSMAASLSLGWRRAVLAILLAVGVTFVLFAPMAEAASAVSVATTTT